MAGLLLEEVPIQTAGEACPLDHYLVMPDDTMDARIAAAREKLGTDVVLLGHHYQRDEVFRFADFTGIKQLVDEMKTLAGKGELRFTPCKLLQTMAGTGRKFYDK